VNRRWLLGGAAALAVLVAFALVLPTLDLSDAQFSAYGDSDEDASLVVNRLRGQGFEVASLTLGTPALDGMDPERSDAFYLAVGPDRGYPTPEVDAVERFVEDGGTAIVLDDTGASDALLDRFGLDKGAPLLSTEGSTSVVRVDAAGRLVNLQEPVELVVQEGTDATVLGAADNSTAKDVGRTGTVEAEDPTCEGGCPVVVRVDRGDGSLYVVGDATFATNRYASGSGAISLLGGLAGDETTGQRAVVAVDESRHVAGPSEIGLTLFRVLMTPLGLTGVAAGLSALVLAAAVAAAVRREDAAWPEHDPGFDDPYLDTEAEPLEGSP
jgi:hypothetical protein